MTLATSDDDALSSINAALMGEGARNAFGRDAAVGDSLSGTIISATRQQRKNKKGELLYWLDQRPQAAVTTDEPVWDNVLTVQLDAPESDDDEGIRRIWVDAGIRTALRTVLRAARVNGVEIGGRIDGLMLVGEDQRGRRIYEAAGYQPRGAAPKATASL